MENIINSWFSIAQCATAKAEILPNTSLDLESNFPLVENRAIAFTIRVEKINDVSLDIETGMVRSSVPCKSTTTARAEFLPGVRTFLFSV